MDSQFSLELPNASTSRHELGAASGCDKVQHPLTKLRGVTASSHAVLQCLGGTAAWPIPIIRLQQIQGALTGSAVENWLRTRGAPAGIRTVNLLLRRAVARANQSRSGDL